MTDLRTEIFDDRPCNLGEGALWHPERQQLFWFDITEGRLLSRVTGDDDAGEVISEPPGAHSWHLGEMVSAAGWIDRDRLLVAGESALWRLDLQDGSRERLCPLEADFPANRSNDGRADPWGGFWIGTMGKNAEPGAGSIYRYYRGELRRLVAGLTIPNAICFPPDGAHAYYVDTKEGCVMRMALSPADGWPRGDARLWRDFADAPWGVDGAIFDADGNFWNAHWGGSAVACYTSDGKLIRTVAMPASQVTCPAIGGPGLDRLFATSAAQGLSASAREKEPAAGMTFATAIPVRGQAEHRVVL